MRILTRNGQEVHVGDVISREYDGVLYAKVLQIGIGRHFEIVPESNVDYGLKLYVADSLVDCQNERNGYIKYSGASPIPRFYVHAVAVTSESAPATAEVPSALESVPERVIPPTPVIDPVDIARTNAIAETVDSGKYELGQIIATRNERGFVLKVRSEAIENFMKTACSERTSSNANWGNVYSLPESLAYKTFATFTISKVGGSLDAEGKVNLSWMRCKGLKDGVEIKFDGLYTYDEVQEYAIKVKKQIAKFYSQYMKPITAKITLTAVLDINEEI